MVKTREIRRREAYERTPCWWRRTNDHVVPPQQSQKPFALGDVHLSMAADTHYVGQGTECGFEANFETYGLGVRLGIYLSWLSVVIACAWFPKLRADMLDAIVIFSVAFFAATMLVSIIRQNTYTVEIVIMGYIFFGGALTTGVSVGCRSHDWCAA